MTVLSTLPDNESACARAAHELARVIVDSRRARGAAHIALAGGNTPRRAYELLVDLVADWSGVTLWYGDERCVGPEDPQSNHRMVTDSLLGALVRRGASPAPDEQRMLGELGAERAASDYAQRLRDALPADEDGLPVLDLALLGLGEDGHTASLFPGHPQIDGGGETCLPVHDSPKPPPDRVTLTLDVLNAARETVLLATGAGKASALAGVLAGPDRAIPASLLGPGRLHVITDEAAAGAPT